LTSEVALAVALILALALAVYFWRQRQQALHDAGLAAKAWSERTDQAPMGLIWERADDTGASARARELLPELDPPSPERIAEFLREPDRARYAAALSELRQKSAPFDLFLDAADGTRTFRLSGRREDAGLAVWIADDTQRTALARAYAEREDQVATLTGVLQMLPLPVWWRADRSQSLAGCNKAYAQALDLDTDSVVANQRELGAGYLSADGKGLAERAMRTRLAQSESHHVVLGGERRLLDFTEIPIDGTDGAVGGYAVDVTALEEVQAELASHIAAHADVLEQLGSAIAIFGPDKRLKFFNTAFARLWQIEGHLLDDEPTLGEILEMLRERRRLPEIVDFPAYKQEQDARFTSLIDPVEELLHLPDERTLRTVVSPHPFGGLLMVYEDVTDRLALERSYNTLIDVQKETLDNLQEGVAVFGSDGRLKLFNPRYAALWTLPETFLETEPHVTDVLERSKEFYPHDGDWQEAKRSMVFGVTEPSGDSGQIELTNGTILDYANVPLPNGECLLLYTDVSDSVQVNRALVERNLALEKADKLKSQFIANVSYELRTPLNAIIGFTEVLNTGLPGDLTEKQRDYVGSILKASHNLMALINDILDLATIEAGFMNLRMEPVDLHSLMEGLIEVTKERAEEAGLGLIFDCPANIGSVNCDGTRIRQAVFNLISNALKFTPAEGTVTLTARRQKGNVRITVRDTGIGIAPENQERVLDKFERADPNRRESAAGLGLALTKSLIELHGGSVILDSAPGKGTSVTCLLPVKVESETPPETVESSAA